jgi:hypothetical protein
MRNAPDKKREMGGLRLADRPILDLHVHVGPELLSRRYTVDSLAEEARREFFGFAAKNHFQPTTAWVTRIHDPHAPPRVGSITLNKGVGGIHPEAVRAALSGFKRDPLKDMREPGRFIVWMPTIHAEAHLVHNGRSDIITQWGCSPEYPRVYPDGEGLTVLDPRSGKLSKETLLVLDLIAREDLILATGHLSCREVEQLVPEAVDLGVKRIIVTHPFYQATNMPLETQVKLSRLDGVYIEMAYVNLEIDKIPLETYVALIKATRAHKVFLSTDLGQPGYEPVGTGWRRFLDLLREKGVSEGDLVRMAVDTPHHIVFDDM